jgi:hypothetical protein
MDLFNNPAGCWFSEFAGPQTPRREAMTDEKRQGCRLYQPQGVSRSETPEMKNGKDAIFHPRKGLQRKYRSPPAAPRGARNWSGKPGFLFSRPARKKEMRPTIPDDPA